MWSWKSVLTCILFAYLVLASAISLLMDYVASAALTTPDRQASSSYSREIPATEPSCKMTLLGGDAGASPPLTSGRSVGLNGNSWDFSGPDDIPGAGPARLCDQHLDP